MSTFAERLQRALSEAGMTPYGLSKQMGWSANYVSKLLKSKAAKGATASVRPANLDRMAIILAVRSEWLGFERGPMHHEDEKRRWEAMRTNFDKAVDYWRGHVSESAVVAVEAWAMRHDPPEMTTLAWGQLFQQAQEQLMRGLEPTLPPPKKKPAPGAENDQPVEVLEPSAPGAAINS